MKLVRKKKKLWKKIKVSRCQELSCRFTTLRKRIKKLIQANYHCYLRSLPEKLKTNPKQFWSFYSLKSKSRRIPQAVSYENIIATDPTKKPELFNRFF